MSNSNIAVTTTIAAIAAALGFGLCELKNVHEASVSSQDVSAQYANLHLDSSILPISNSPVKGGVNALATVVIFTDFSTPAGRYIYREALDPLFKAHGKNVAVVYKSYPLRDADEKRFEGKNLNPLSKNGESMLRARAAVAAQKLNRFWEYADKLAALDKGQFNEDEAIRIASELGIDGKKFKMFMDSDDTQNRIEADSNLAQKLGVKGAPAVFINGKELKFKGNVTKDELLQAVNDEVARVGGLTNANYIVSTMISEHSAKALQSFTAPDGRPARGAQNALVTIVEYSDYQCPFCSRVEPTIAAILNNYPDTVRVIFNHNPLPMHKDAKLAHQAAHAAGLQGKFWEMHDVLFKNQKNLKEPDLIKYAETIGLNVDKFKSDLHSPQTVAAIDKALKIAEDNQISGTPNFSINGEPIKGAQPYEQFKTKIDDALEKAQKLQKQTGLEGENLYKELLKRNAPKPPARQFVDFNGAPALGPVDAPITLIEFTDFQCPYCKRANDTVHELMEKNPGKIRLVFKHNPLPFHDKADGAHRAAEAAALQGKFWEMYDLLFANNKKLDQSDLESYAAQIGLDVERLKADMESDTVKNRVKSDLSQGASVGVKGTPHFFMNGTVINGAQPLAKFQSELDKELAIADKYLKRGTTPDALYKTIYLEEKKLADADDARPKLARPIRGPRALPEVPAAPIVLNQGQSYAKGPENAPITIYQFSEFQCPFCGKVEPTIKQLEEAYGDKIRIIFKNNPLPFHGDAKLASEAALAAGAQGKFWEMHAILFANQKSLKREALVEYAKQLGLDIPKFEADLDNHTYAAQVEAEMAEAKDAGVSGTPTFVINGQKFVGAQPFEKFKDLIDGLLAGK